MPQSPSPTPVPLAARPLLDGPASDGLAQVFGVLASATRLRLLHALILRGDPCMTELAGAVGMKPQAVSNQLRKLVDLGILDTCRHGAHAHYRIRDPRVAELMHHGLCLTEASRTAGEAR